MASKVTTKVRESGIAVKDRGVVILDSYIPPSQREELSQALRGWAAHHPKFAAFLASHVILSGPPIILFLAFILTIFASSLLVCTLIAITVALAFTAFCAGLAVLILFPTLLLTTITATFLFITAIIGNAAVSKFNNDPRTEGIRSRAKSNAVALGDKVKDASNGSIDLNSATQQLADGIASKTTIYATSDDAASEERARQYLARQALGISEEAETVPNGNSTHKQPRAINPNIDVTSGDYVRPVVDQIATDTQKPPGRKGVT